MRLLPALRPALALPLLGMFTLSHPAPAQLSAASAAVPPPERAATTTTTTTILCLGDSLTAGYGLDDPALAFPNLLEKRLAASGRTGRYEVVNAGLSGDTSAGGLRRVDWLLSRRAPDILVLELGANDGLRGIAPEETRRNLQAIIEKVKAKNPRLRVLVAGMMLPPSLGKDYTDRFAAIFPAVAKANDAGLIPFILEGVGGDPKLNQRDGVHPTAEGQRIVADVVWRKLEPLLTGG